MILHSVTHIGLENNEGKSLIVVPGNAREMEKSCPNADIFWNGIYKKEADKILDFLTGTFCLCTLSELRQKLNTFMGA